VKIRSGTFRNSEVRETVKLLCADHPRLKDGLKILNVGFGLGIVSRMLSLSVLSLTRPDVKDRFFLSRTLDLPGLARYYRTPSGCSGVHEIPGVVLETERENPGGKVAGLHRFA
jgi:hypothetical protein